uniref:Ig-like domain-containing protein n=1 Tax=Oncorhynchus kisutch TaxID=8019 RepID=A0A8C7M392_ONCKI
MEERNSSSAERREVPDEAERCNVGAGHQENLARGQWCLQLRALEEGSVTLRCELSKSGVPVVWLKGGELLREGERHQMKQEGRTVEMVIRNAVLQDAGEYSCVVNTFGVSSYNGNITVGEPQMPPSSTQRPAAPSQPSTPSVHPVLASIGPLQPVQTSTPGKETVDSVDSVECEGISLWQTYNLTKEDPRRTLQERRRASLIAASSSKSS